jgi:GTPase
MVMQQASAPDEGQLAHSGFVAVVGRPNVGKSTLMNRILGEKIAIVSPKPQTTRLRQFGIYSQPGVQIVFVDTPGIHQPRHKLGEFMVDIAVDALRDADLILFVIDLSLPPNDEDKRVADLIRESRTATPVMIAMNKIDRLSPDQIQRSVDAYRALLPDADWTTLSATLGKGVDDLLKRLIDKLQPGPQFFPEDQLSDTALRDIVGEIIREKVLLNTEQEVPHAVAVEVLEFKERSPELTYISANIYVERDSQKGILIGKGGAMLKKISSEARVEIEQLIGTKVYLELWVKVLKNWRRDEAVLKRLGYKIGK